MENIMKKMSFSQESCLAQNDIKEWKNCRKLEETWRKLQQNKGVENDQFAQRKHPRLCVLQQRAMK